MSLRKLIWLLPLALVSCGQQNESEQERKSAITHILADTTAAEGNMPLTSPNRKIIRTADVRCRVKDVHTAVASLERIVKNAGGIVQQSDIANSTGELKTSYYTADSLRQAQVYMTTATMTLRVPTLMLDSVMNAIPGLVSFTDSRSVKQNDVTWQYVSNSLKNEIGDEVKDKQDATATSKNKTSNVQAVQYYDNRAEQKADREIENLRMMDDVSYATLTVALSQPEQVLTQIVVDADHVSRTPAGMQCKAALYNGWNGIVTVMIALINVWPLLLLIPVWIVCRKAIKKKIQLR